jgi:hypothetical protein
MLEYEKCRVNGTGMTGHMNMESETNPPLMMNVLP